jgi:S-layer protein (TIGR01564 family)
VYDSVRGNITLWLPEKTVTYGVGSYIYADEQTISAGASAEFDDVEVFVSSVTGVALNYITPGIGRLSNDAVFTTPTKPLILVGGPAANSLVASAGLTNADFQVNGTYWSGHALVKLYDSVEALNNQTVLVIAGVDAADTVMACRLVAKELVNDMNSPLDLNGTEVWLGTGVTAVDEVTVVTK